MASCGFRPPAGLVKIDPQRAQHPAAWLAIEQVTLDRMVLPSGQAVKIRPGQENLEIAYTG